MSGPSNSVFFPPLKDWSLSAAVAGILASTMGYAGPLVILFKVAEAANLSNEVLTSWIWGMFEKWTLEILPTIPQGSQQEDLMHCKRIGFVYT